MTRVGAARRRPPAAALLAWLLLAAAAGAAGAGAGAGGTETERVSALLSGDFLIGALFSLHHQPKQKRAANTLVCGEVREMYGIQRVEVTFLTLDRINADPEILPNVTLGVEIRDSCWYAPVALQQSIEFIRDAISPAAAAGAGGGGAGGPDAEQCLAAQAPGALQPGGPPMRYQGGDASQGRPGAGVAGRPPRAPLVGVVGPASSSVAIQVQNLLQLFQIPQVGYSTTSKDLSDKSRFNYFLRVVPSDYYQAQVMVDVVRRFNWTYVSAVNTDENYGQSGIQAFRELAERAGVCIAKEDSVLSNAEDDVFDSVIRKLQQDKQARVVVCFCEGMTVRGLLGATRRLNLTGYFLFIGSDGWADRADVTDGLESEAQGSMSIRIHSPTEPSFDDYYFRLSPFNNTRNPWFREFWQWRFNCVMPDEASNSSGGDVGAESVRLCTGREKLSERYKPDPKLSFIIKAIYTMAYGLHNMHQDVCGHNAVGLCPDLFPFNGSLFKSYLMNVSFAYKGSSDDMVEFDRQGDPPGRYDIMNYQQLPNGSYDYIMVGDWNNGTLVMDRDLQLSHRMGGAVESVCSKPCAAGAKKSFQKGGQEQKCCWVCVPCDRNWILVDDETCEECKKGTWPNENQTECLEIPVEYVHWTDTQAIVAMAFSALGFASTFAAAAVFVRHNDTPVVKASTRELSYLILAGMALSHAATFAVLAKPASVSCSLARTLPGLSFAMIYASLLVKTNRIARILAGSKKEFPTRKRCMSASAQVVITTTLIAVESAVAAAMLILEPPAATLLFPTLERSVLACNTSPLGVLAPLAFDFLLIALCTLYALKTRNVPENFNEAKFIGFAMYTTCVIWIAFVPIYFGSDSKVITMCMCVTLSAQVTLVFLYLPKLYIILLRPERNDRAFFTTTKIRCHIGSRVGSAPASKNGSNSYHSAGETGSHDVSAAGFFSGGTLTERRPELRTLSVQTGSELLQLLLQEGWPASTPAPARRPPVAAAAWRQLNPRALLEDTIPAGSGGAHSGACSGSSANVHAHAQPALHAGAGRPRRRRGPRVAVVEAVEAVAPLATTPTPGRAHSPGCGVPVFTVAVSSVTCKHGAAHILEESASDQSGDDDSGRLKHITISLGSGNGAVAECHSPDRSSCSSTSWSAHSESIA